MLQLRVDLPAGFELEDGVLTQDGIHWLEMYQALMDNNGFTNFKVVRVKT